MHSEETLNFERFLDGRQLALKTGHFGWGQQDQLTSPTLEPGNFTLEHLWTSFEQRSHETSDPDLSFWGSKISRISANSVYGFTGVKP